MSDPKPRTAFQPTDGLSYDPSEERYWDQAALEKETRRVFDVCNGCRLCFKYCDAFPTLFKALDEPARDGDVAKLGAPEIRKVEDSCFQCKLCEVQCPYTPRDKHEFALDFPKLMHRARAVRAREEGFSLRDRVLGNPDGAARLARLSFGLANLANSLPPHRWFLEKVLGIHRKKLLPAFARRTFERWARRSGRTAKGPGGEAVLFPGCYVNGNEPGIGRDTVEVLERNGVDLRCTTGLACCGMPAWERGDLERLRSQAREILERLVPYVAKGAKVLVLNPTCAMVMRREWALLLEPADRPAAAALAEAIRDPSEFLMQESRLRAIPSGKPEGPIAYHIPCHLRTQGVGFKGRDLLRQALGVPVTLVQECSGHDGTYAMTVEGFEPSQRIGKKAFDGMREAAAPVWVSDCPLAALQFAQHAGRKPLHPMTVLARAYRGEGIAP
ncbi:MAG: 4Fe-4S dicluster domain-containing protein [Planctomycetales bacterium]|nr:4Fe-4S dicluster domain-containing protein [Planctomycetales bacterium]